MAKQKAKSSQIDWSSFANNIKMAKNSSSVTPTIGTDNNLASAGAAITFTVDATSYALVTVHVGCRSTTDYEHKPAIYLDGTLISMNDIGASIGGSASNRGIQRSHTDKVTLSAGAHTISAGIYIASATSPSVAIGEAQVSAIVLGRVTA